MSEEIQKGALPPRRERTPPEGGCGPESDFRLAPPYPPTLVAAGVSWIVCGCLLLLYLLILWFRIFVGGLHAGGRAPWDFGLDVCRGLFVTAFFGWFGGAFIFVGIQSVRGTARYTLWDGIGSIVLGLLLIGGGVAAALGRLLIAGGVAVEPTPLTFLYMGLASLGAVALLAAGVLALVSSGQYKLWRTAQEARRAGAPPKKGGA